jgi:hypothetical protein
MIEQCLNLCVFTFGGGLHHHWISARDRKKRFEGLVRIAHLCHSAHAHPSGAERCLQVKGSRPIGNLFSGLDYTPHWLGEV